MDPDSAVGPSPYPGLRPFEAHEADLFFGREEHTDRLLEILQAQRFLAVIGPSGSGKSSLVRAGLLPALALGSLGSGSDWRIAVMRPADRPVDALAEALLQPAVLGRELGAADPDAAACAALAAELRRGPLGLVHAVSPALAASDGSGGRRNLLVLVDQFEELFTHADAGGAQADESEAFVNLLLAAARAPGAALFVVLTMRTDFLGACVRFAELPEAINRALYLTPRLSRVQMERAIVAPAQVCGGDIDATLVTELINATGRNSDQLPLVQHALSRMWLQACQRDADAPRIGWDDAQAVGGIRGALHQHAQGLADQARAGLPPERQELVEQLFRFITERRPGGQDVRRPRTLARIARACGMADDELPLLQQVVRVFAAPDASLLQHGPRLDADSVIDLSHEALIRQWDELKAWVTDEARRGAEQRRWAERAADAHAGRASLLVGPDLSRALEWWNPHFAYSKRHWQPTAVWAERYASTADEAAARAEFDLTIAFFEASCESERERERLMIEEDKRQRRMLEESERAAVERSQQARAEARRARRYTIGLAVLSVSVLILAVAAVRAMQQSARDAEAARQANVVVAAEKARAESLARRLDAQLNLAIRTETAPDGAPTTPGPAPTATGAQARPITLADLAAIMPASSEAHRRDALAGLNAAMQEFGIDTRLRQAHFLAQAAYESGELRSLEEAWTGSAQQLRYEPPSTLATSLGNVEPGDGRRYRGRGYVSLTGRSNYKTYGDALGIDLLAQPDLAARWDVGARVFGVYWKTRQLNALADADDVAGITRRISGGRVGLAQREEYLVRAKAALGG